jgi:hypothetical protein
MNGWNAEHIAVLAAHKDDLTDSVIMDREKNHGFRQLNLIRFRSRGFE